MMVMAPGGFRRFMRAARVGSAAAGEKIAF